MALFDECMQKCAQKVLDLADIVRDGDFSPTEAYLGLATKRRTRTASSENIKAVCTDIEDQCKTAEFW